MNHQYCLDVGGFVLADTPGGKDELRSLANEEIRHLVDEMRPNSAPADLDEGPRVADERRDRGG